MYSLPVGEAYDRLADLPIHRDILFYVGFGFIGIFLKFFLLLFHVLHVAEKEVGLLQLGHLGEASEEEGRKGLGLLNVLGYQLPAEGAFHQGEVKLYFEGKVYFLP